MKEILDQLRLFQNRVVAKIAIAIMILFFGGWIMLIAWGSILGLGMVFYGLYMFIKGLTKFETSPFEGGALTHNKKIIEVGPEDDKKSLVVTGITLLANYFPWYIGAEKLNFGNITWKFPMELYSVETKDPITGLDLQVPLNIPVQGDIVVIGVPDPDDALDFIKAGADGEKIKPQIADFVYVQAQNVVVKERLSMMQIAQQEGLIREPLMKRITFSNGKLKAAVAVPDSDSFHEKSFGVKIIQINSNFTVPKFIKKAMEDAGRVKFEAAAQRMSAEADASGAKLMKDTLNITDGAEAWDKYIQADLLRRSLLVRHQLEVMGKGKLSVYGGMNLHMGDQRRGGGGRGGGGGSRGDQGGRQEEEGED